MIAVGLVISGLGGYGAYYFGQKITRETEARQASSGVLVPAPGIVVSTKRAVYPEMEYGDSGLVIPGHSKNLFNYGEGSTLNIEIAPNGQLEVSAVIRDPNGNVIAELTRNNWKINPAESFDRNYTANALEVRDVKGEVVLQVRLVSNRVQLQAKLYEADGTGLILYSPKRGVGSTQFVWPGLPAPEIHIKPLFKYPSDAHLGEFAEKE